MRLSVCVVMKNSEKTIKDCLESVKEILNRDDCELIIADTGSDDGSKEIVSAYNGRIFDYEWQDDFSEVRNFCIEKAEGEWVFFIDTDEILENPQELNSFINNGTDADYALTALRRYGGKYEYTDTFPVRLFRRGRLKYKNAVCEVPEKIPQNAVHTNIIIKHNFIFNADRFNYFDSLLKKVYERDKEDWFINLKMMEYAALRNEAVNIDKYGKKAVELGKNSLVRAVLINEYTERKNYYKAELLIKEHTSDIYDLPVYSAYIDILHSITRYDDIDKIYNIYLNAFAKYKDGGFDDEIKCGLYLSGHSDAAFRINTIRYINSLTGRGKYKQAEEMMKTQLPLNIYDENSPDLEERIKCELNLLRKSGSAELFPEAFAEFAALNRKKTIDIIDLIYKDITEDISEELAVFYEKGGEGAYEALLKLRYCDLEGKEPADAHKLIADALAEPDEVKDILYYIFKYEYPITEWTERVDPFDTAEMFGILPSYSYKNTFEMAVAYLDTVDEIHTLEDIIAVSQLYEIIFSGLNAAGFDKNKAEEIFSIYAMVMEQYMNAVYKKEMLNDDNIYRLPSNIVFAYFAAKASDKKNEGNIKEYLAYLNKALQAKQTFNPIITVLLNAVKERIELDGQYRKIKMLIKHCITAGEITDAYNYLNEYAKMNPNDPELEELVDMLEEAAR